MKKFNVTTYKYEKIAVKDTELLIPDEPFYCFQTGVRRAVRIIPTFVTWDSAHLKKGDILNLEVTCIYQSFECVVEKFNINIISADIGNLLKDDNTSKPAEIMKMLLAEDYSVRTKDQFEADLNMVISRLKTMT